jgi:hypothetical protein
MDKHRKLGNFSGSLLIIMYSVTMECGTYLISLLGHQDGIILGSKNVKMGIPFSGLVLVTSFMKICQMVKKY